MNTRLHRVQHNLLIDCLRMCLPPKVCSVGWTDVFRHGNQVMAESSQFLRTNAVSVYNYLNFINFSQSLQVFLSFDTIRCDIIMIIYCYYYYSLR
jgi:hypothetical protein